MKKIIIIIATLSLFLLPANFVYADDFSDCLKKAQDTMEQGKKDAVNDAFLAKFDALVWKDNILKSMRDVFNATKIKAQQEKNVAIEVANTIEDEVARKATVEAANNIYKSKLVEAWSAYVNARKPILDQYRQKIKDIDKNLKDKILYIQKKYEEDKKACGNLTLVDCGTAPDNMEEDASGKPNHYDAFVCLGKAVLNNCQPAKLALVEESGEVSYNLSVEKSGALGCIGKVSLKEKGTNPDDTPYVKYLSGQCDLNLEKIREKEALFERLPDKEAADFMPYYWITNQLFVLSAIAAPTSLDLNQVPPEFRSQVQGRINRIYAPAADLGVSLGMDCNK